MKNYLFFLIFSFLSLSLNGQSLSTSFASDNGASGIFFNIIAGNAVIIEDFETNLDVIASTGSPSPPWEFQIYYLPGRCDDRMRCINSAIKYRRGKRNR